MKKLILSALIALAAVGVFAAFKGAFAAEAQTYTVKPGDSLSLIAQNQLGDVNRWVDIYNLNKDQISDPNVIFSGEVLLMPDTSASSVQPIPIFSSTPLRPNVVTQNIVIKEVPEPVVQQPVYTYTSHTSYLAGKALYEPIIFAAAAKYRVNPYEMENIIACESGYNPNAYNPSGATGIAQFMPGTYYGSWNPYKDQYDIWNPTGQIYAMALKISQGGATAWSCYRP